MSIATFQFLSFIFLIINIPFLLVCFIRLRKKYNKTEKKGWWKWLWNNQRKTSIYVLLLIVPQFVIASLNYSGMCISEGRWLSDEERIDNSIKAIITRDTLPVRTNDRGTQYFKQVKYNSIEEFKKENPECCKINPDKGYDLPPISLLDRIQGFNYGKVVGINFIAYYKDNNGDIKQEERKSRSFQSNCGKPR